MKLTLPHLEETAPVTLATFNDQPVPAQELPVVDEVVSEAGEIQLAVNFDGFEVRDHSVFDAIQD